MKRQEQLSQSETDSKTAIKLLQGRDGRDGCDGVQGIKGDVGERGEKGDQGFRGQKGEPAEGVVYVRWGRDSCPSTGANLVYSGRTGGSEHRNAGGGSNLQCLPLDPTLPKLKYDIHTKLPLEPYQILSKISTWQANKFTDVWNRISKY